MKLSKEKKNRIKKLLEDIIDDIELTDIKIAVIGYKDFDIADFETNLDVNKIMKVILEIIEKEE